jgi:hypothetical protein
MLNLIERFFAELTCEVFREGSFQSPCGLVPAVESYVAEHNEPQRVCLASFWSEAFPGRTETAMGGSWQLNHSEGASGSYRGARSNLKIFLNEPGIAVDTLLIQPAFVPAYFWAVKQEEQRSTEAFSAKDGRRPRAAACKRRKQRSSVYRSDQT